VCAATSAAIGLIRAFHFGRAPRPISLMPEVGAKLRS
jgi:hypothetical protein